MTQKYSITPKQMLSIYENQRQRLDSLNQQIEMLRHYVQTLTMAKEALEGLSISKDKSFYIDLGAQTYIPVKLAGNTVKMDANLGYFTGSTPKEAKKKIDTRIEKAKKTVTNMRKQAQEITKGIVEIEGQLRQLQQTKQG